MSLTKWRFSCVGSFVSKRWFYLHMSLLVVTWYLFVQFPTRALKFLLYAELCITNWSIERNHILNFKMYSLCPGITPKITNTLFLEELLSYVKQRYPVLFNNINIVLKVVAYLRNHARIPRVLFLRHFLWNHPKYEIKTK